jgi:hydroxymethylpyrimidine pyrophosphatase-like HAD family hydrolase
MLALPAPASPAAILSFDFDGTLHHVSGRPPVPVEFFELIRQLRAERNVVWGINTGRSMPLLVEGFIESDFPFLPDWMVAREREIYFPDAQGHWQPQIEWNQRCHQQIHDLFTETRPLLRQIRKLVEEHTGALWQEMEGEPAGFITQNEEEMEWLLTQMEPLVSAEPHLSWQRNSIWLRFGHRDYQKGSSLRQIATHYGLSAAECFACGDGHNDLEMLDPTYAEMNACPANSVAAIKEKVAATGGYIAKAAHGHGSIEALRHYFNMA